MLRALAAAALFARGTWFWRRVMALAAAAVELTGILHATFGDHDLAHATMVMSNCQQGLALVLGNWLRGGKPQREGDAKSSIQPGLVMKGQPLAARPTTP